ncbi:MAG: 3'-5' exonuclease [Oscillospiraceae bacterium]
MGKAKTINGQCALCRQNKELQLSHIVPHFVGRKMIKTAPGNIRITNEPTSILYEAINRLYTSNSVYQFMQNAEKYLQGLGKDYSKKDKDNHYKEPQFFRLTELAKKYGNDYRKFYRDIEKARRNGEKSRIRNNDDTENGFNEINNIPIHLLTATRSKGHEYDAVIILDAYDGEWPHYLSDDTEEERRLFYVAITRARKYLYISTSEDKKKSRFIDEMGIL